MKQSILSRMFTLTANKYWRAFMFASFIITNYVISVSRRCEKVNWFCDVRPVADADFKFRTGQWNGLDDATKCDVTPNHENMFTRIDNYFCGIKILSCYFKGKTVQLNSVRCSAVILFCIICAYRRRTTCGYKPLYVYNGVHSPVWSWSRRLSLTEWEVHCNGIGEVHFQWWWVVFSGVTCTVS